jgi:ubiquinone/menaquinone biosynthesis C-methylase UbiE
VKLDAVQQAAQEQFARQSRNYGRSHILADVSDLEAALEGVALPSRARVLDVATGGGHTGLHLASLGHDVICTDLAAPMLERVQEAARERGLTVQTRQHPAEELPYDDGSFDLVISRIAPHHFSSPESFVRESARVLKPGGWFVVIDGSVPDDQPEAEEWLHQVEKHRDPSHHRLLTPRVWTSLCEAQGLRVQSAALRPLKQPDLEWYFQAAATSPENQQIVRDLIANAPESARTAFRLAEEEGMIVARAEEK